MDCLELSPEEKLKAVEVGTFTLEQFMDAEEQYKAFVAKVEEEWPPGRIREYILGEKRKAYTFFSKRAVEIEQTNLEARKKGVSYAKRAAYSSQIATLQRMAGEVAQWGRDIKRSPLQPAGAYIRPSYVEVIESRGFEYFLHWYVCL